MRQGGRAQHHAKHEGQEIVALDVGLFAVRSRKRLRVRNDRFGAFLVLRLGCLPQHACFVRTFRIGNQVALRIADVEQRGIALAQTIELALGRQAALFPGTGQAVNARLVALRALAEDGAHFVFFRVRFQHVFAHAQLRQHLAVSDLRHGIVRMLDRQPHGGNQKGDEDDDVLRHLRPGDGAHAAQKGAHEDAGQAQEDADGKIHAREARGDQADGVDLRHHIRKRHDDGGGHGHHAHAGAPFVGAAAVAGGEEIGNRVLAELAQVGRDQ
ncbi:hypothetical protein D3C72_1268270 [compost metagenome]